MSRQFPGETTTRHFRNAIDSSDGNGSTDRIWCNAPGVPVVLLQLALPGRNNLGTTLEIRTAACSQQLDLAPMD